MTDFLSSIYFTLIKSLFQEIKIIFIYMKVWLFYYFILSPKLPCITGGEVQSGQVAQLPNIFD